MIATEDDLPLIVELGREAHGKSAWAGLAEFDADSFETTCRGLMHRNTGAVFITDRGCLCLAKFPLYFNHLVTVTHEVFFYATKGGDALRREGERWAEGLITMSRNAATDARLDTLYQRAGYVPIEHTFIRRA